MVEQHLGRARYIRFYLMCGVGGAIAYLALLTKGVLVADRWVPLVGASAGIFGVLVAAAHVAPNAMIMMLFPPVPMRLRTLAWVFIAIAVYTVFTRGSNAGGEAAHLGGAIVGALLMQGERLLGDQRRTRGFPMDDY
jgi:membrane associated rhomboid family serine protease